jgi:hypothetical protein
MSDQQSVRQVNGEKPRARVLVLYLLLVSLAMFLVLEFFCRIMVPAPFKMGTLVEDEVFGAVPGGFEAYTAAAKGPDLKRMLLLGDSFSEGSGARSRSEGFAGLLARRLKDEATGWELVNAGVRGWGSTMERHLLEHEGGRLEPDLVIVQVFLGNDITDATGITKVVLFSGVPVREYYVRSRTNRMLTWARIHSRLAHVVVSGVTNVPLLLARRDATPPYPDVAWRTLIRRPPWTDGVLYALSRGTDEFYESGMVKLLENLESMADWCRSADSALLVFLIPSRLQVIDDLRRYAFELNGIDEAEADPKKFNRRIVSHLTERNIDVIDLTPLIEARPSDAPLLYHTGPDNHFNDAGHRFAADVLFEWTRERMF